MYAVSATSLRALGRAVPQVSVSLVNQLLLPHVRPSYLRQISRSARDEKADLLLESTPCPVPIDQQPMQELKQLQEAFLYDWAALPAPEFGTRLGVVFLAFFMLLGLPVSAFTFDLHKELLQCIVAASAGSIFIVTVVVLQLYLGWSYVGNRLLSATVEYEETGWYDGEVWVKHPQVLMRDRLLSNYTVKPVLRRLKTTLLSLGGGLAAAMLVLAVVPLPQAQSRDVYDTTTMSSPAPSVSKAYWESVEVYEPWGLQEQDDEAQQQLSVLEHMRL